MKLHINIQGLTFAIHCQRARPLPAVAVTWKWIVRPARWCTRAAWTSRSSLDSVQQALFFSHVTGKRPAVVIYDTDGREGRFEYRIRIACRRAGVRYEVFRKGSRG